MKQLIWIILHTTDRLLIASHTAQDREASVKDNTSIIPGLIAFGFLGSILYWIDTYPHGFSYSQGNIICCTCHTLKSIGLHPM